MSDVYFFTHLAALPGLKAELMTAVAEKVSQQVASHIRLIPRLKGKSVIPSGRRPSPLSRPVGSKTLEPCAAECPPQHVIKVGVTCVAASTLGTGETVVAQSISRTTAELAVVRSHTGAPSRSATATRTVSSSRWSPRLVTGRACTQAAVWGSAAARRRTRTTWFAPSSRRC